MERSMLDIAYEIIGGEKSGVSFADLFAKVCTAKGIDDAAKASYIGRFYTDLSLDGRFVVLDNNVWDLRERYTYDNVHVEIGNAYAETEQATDDAEEEAESKEYDASVQGISVEALDNATEEVKDEEAAETKANTNPEA